MPRALGKPGQPSGQDELTSVPKGNHGKIRQASARSRWQGGRRTLTDTSKRTNITTSALVRLLLQLPAEDVAARRHVVLDLSGAMREGGMLLLSMRWSPATGLDAPAGPEGLPIALRRDGLCVVVADSEDMPQISMVTVDGELALLRVGDGLVDCNRLAWASRVANGLPVQAVSAHRALNMLVIDEADGIDVEAEVCRLMGFDPATYALVEGLATDSTDNESEESRF